MKRRRKSRMFWLSATGCMALFAGLNGVTAVAGMSISDAPDEVTIDSIAEFYQPVAFNHAMHTDITSGDCTVCHHHTTGSPPKEKPCINCHNGGKEADTVSCRECHLAKPFEAAAVQEQQKDVDRYYHIDKPGLKVAYHLNCLGCHQATGGPVGCQDCHIRTEAGDKLFHAKKR